MFYRIMRGGLAAAVALGCLLLTAPAGAAPTDAGSVAAPRPTLVPVGTGSPELESQRQATTRAAATASGRRTSAALAPPQPCWQNVSFRRYGLTRYVSMELQYPGDRKYELRARSDSVGPWELFTLCRDPFSEVTTIRSQSNHNYVSVEEAYQGTIYAMLRARTGEVNLGPWELFYSDIEPGQGYCGQIRANSNGLFVAAEEDYAGTSKGMLRARTTAAQIGTWETFCY
ncbi:fascin domain-containing protein [Micromonospora maritima]|uniref:fascin domain-containing protein n=1 Tax=Micromonospora maritima TaxID=986711 RepID=UPI00157D2FE4|nr:hypothetical protein [Micromonospora maritima]